MRSKKTEMYYLIMMLPGFAFLLLFNYIPMFGIVIAFEKFIPAKGILRSPWIGLDNFKYILQMPEVWQIFCNTIVIACSKIILGIIIPVFYALLLNEVHAKWFKRTIQTIIYVPHFLSWVILATIIRQMFSLTGIVNQSLGVVFGQKVMFLADKDWFRLLIIFSDQWKEFGYGTIIYLAAITSISPMLYEAAIIDGATRFQRLRYITIPGISATIVLLSTLALGRILNAGFDQIFNLYTPLVYETSDIIDTYVYRIGMLSAQYGLSTAVGLLKSVISFVLIIASYKLADRFANYKIF